MHGAALNVFPSPNGEFILKSRGDRSRQRVDAALKELPAVAVRGPV